MSDGSFVEICFISEQMLTFSDTLKGSEKIGHKRGVFYVLGWEKSFLQDFHFQTKMSKSLSIRLTITDGLNRESLAENLIK